MRRRGVMRAAAALGLGVIAPTLRAHEYFLPHLTVVHPWTRASAEGATVAIIGMSFIDVTQGDRLIGATSPLAAGAELIGRDGASLQDIAIPAGQNTTLAEGGAHLRLVGLTQPLQIAREYPLTLLFAQAGSLKASFLVDFLPIG
jgi:copper(I)-binding protein